MNCFPTRLLALALTFPSLRHAPLDDGHTLFEWSKRCSATGRLAAHFILNVWDNTKGAPWPAFDGVRAVQLWNRADQGAFLDWAREPWTVDGDLAK